MKGGYQKRVPHDIVVKKTHFSTVYRYLKEKYGYWVREWTESTDPQKFVFEVCFVDYKTLN